MGTNWKRLPEDVITTTGVASWSPKGGNHKKAEEKAIHALSADHRGSEGPGLLSKTKMLMYV